ncbi:MAG: PAS domain S-box protein [Dactylosporangium sp.]|nr:PAS domain S-box protein [Dactylosporangium sp.]NNJ62380.1 PAS domain S-box protein [Dactylosporangium sp.]
MLHTSAWPLLPIVLGLIAAVVSVGMLALAARRCAGSRRRAWRWLAVAGAGWTLSRAWHLLDHAFGHGDTPRATAVSAALTLLPLCGVVGFVYHSVWRPATAIEQMRLSLNAAAATLALSASVWPLPAVLEWRTGLRSPETLAASGRVVTDVLVCAVVLAVAVQGRQRGSTGVRWLLGGLFLTAAAGAVSCVAVSAPGSASWSAADLLWAAGFAAVGFAAARERGGPFPDDDRESPDGSLLHNALPQLMIIVSWLAVGGQWLAGVAIGAVPLVLLSVLGALSLMHQYLVARDSQRLLAQLGHHQEQLLRSTRHDALTGLPNRGAFDILLTETLARRDGRALTVVMFRPSRSQRLDHLGLDEANAIVVELAKRIGGHLGPGDAVARASDLTFAVLVNGEHDAAADFVREVMLAAETPIHTLALNVHLSLAAGFATTPMAGEADPSPADLVQYATIALGTVDSVPGGIAEFTYDMLKAHVARVRLQETIAHTLHADPDSAVTVLFEPVVDLASGHIVGVATRAEWRHEGYPTVSAGQLVGLAREAGLSDRIDYAVLNTAVTSFGLWRDRWPDLCQQLWVTVCAETLASPEADFPTWLCNLLERTGLPANQLIIDPLDSQPYTVETRENLRRLHQTGVRIATSEALVITDSSGRRPGPGDVSGQDAPANYYDISPVLVDQCVNDVRARRLVQATVEFAVAKGGSTSARQVADVAQHEQLRDLGATVARGPFYSAPLFREDAEELIAAAAEGTWQTPIRRETQRRRSSAAWKELRQVIDRLPIATFACDPEGTLVLAEGGLFADLDLPAERLDRPLTSVLGNPAAHNKHPLDAPLRQAHRGLPSVTTVPVGERWLQVHLCSRRESDRTISGVLGVAIDVTHRIQAERALQGSEQRLRNVFAHAPVGMVIIGPDNRIIQANPAIATMLGYAPDDMVGRTVDSLWHPDTPKDTAEQYESLRAGAIPSYRAEQAYLHCDGSPVWARVTLGALSETAVADMIIGIVEDLSQIKQLEVDLRHAQKLEAVGMLAAGIAHEINTPIQFISDNTNFLVQAYEQVTQVITAANRLIPTAGEAATRELATVSEEADLEWLLDQIPRAAGHSLEGVAQVANIVRAMRNFGHPDQRERALVDINAAIQDTAIIAQSEVKHVAELHLDLDDTPPVLGYQSELNQVILNLLVNASHAIADVDRGPGQRGTIRVRTWNEPNEIVMSISDDGCGMSPETRARIFEPFFTTKEVGKGTGQGLAIAYNAVVERHKGSINVDSTPGEGTTFTIRLPLPEEEFDFLEDDIEQLV